jgi:protein-S-isoprenylcysteine O-methyltransferase Ste14
MESIPMAMPSPQSTPPSPPAPAVDFLQVRWVRHVLALVLALAVPLLLRAMAGPSSRGTGFLDFLALVLGFGLIIVGLLLYSWWSYTEWVNAAGQQRESWSDPWRFSQGPTALSRHPAWLAVAALVVGQALVSMTLVAWIWALLVAAGLHFVAVRIDEPQLARLGAEAYDAYRGRVPRWLPWRAALQMLRDIGQILRNSVR